MATTRIEPSRAARPERRPELDAIRTLVVIGLVFFHSALVFDTRDDFYVKNAQTTDVTTIIAGLCVVWAMPILFLIAGLGSWHSLRRRGPAGFAVERLLRLGVPLVFATLTIIPVPQWLRLRADPAYHESYLHFLPRFFDVHLDLTEFPFVIRGEYFESGHLWFVLLLLTFSLLLAPLVHWLSNGHGRRLRDRLASAVRRRGVILLPAVPVAVISALAGLEEGFAAWSRWAYLLFFLYGFMLAADERFRAAMRRDAMPAAVLGLVLFLIAMPGLLIAGDAPGADPFMDMTALAIGARTLYGATGWCWLVAILGLLDRHRPAPSVEQVSPDTPAAGQNSPGILSAGRNSPDDPVVERESPDVPVAGPIPPAGWGRRLYGYLAVAALPLYILHQPIVVAVAYGVVGWDAPMMVKYLVIVAASLTLTVAAYDLLVRRTRVTRFLFGMRG
ncbi:acyltransferase family protein [Streptosporangium subroseum]|uniref:acyltransferase family protein n=1 Tax=Streptosporangium subroseum TaxID=106412 RepID=UPI003084E9D7|nr:acyltransferase [Streptosporangium subroseum]